MKLLQQLQLQSVRDSRIRISPKGQYIKFNDSDDDDHHRSPRSRPQQVLGSPFRCCRPSNRLEHAFAACFVPRKLQLSFVNFNEAPAASAMHIYINKCTHICTYNWRGPFCVYGFKQVQSNAPGSSCSSSWQSFRGCSFIFFVGPSLVMRSLVPLVFFFLQHNF